MTKSPEDNGVVVFEISDFGSGISLDKYAKIFKLLSELSELAELLASIDHPQPDFKFEIPSVVLLDSGSSSNVGLKSTVENAKALFQVFKEVWDWALNHKHYRNKQAVDSLEINLTALTKIQEAQKSGLITEDKAKEYSALVVRKTDELIGLKVLPKQIAVAVSEMSHIELLRDMPSIRQLTEHSDSTESQK